MLLDNDWGWVGLALGFPIAVVVATLLPSRFIQRVLLAVLLGLTSLMTLEWLSSSWIWTRNGENLVFNQSEWVAGFPSLRKGWELSHGERVWSLRAAKEASRLDLTFAARLTDGIVGEDWSLSEEAISLSVLPYRESSLVRATLPTTGDPFLWREWVDEKPLGGRRFRAFAVLRSVSTPQANARSTRGLWLREADGERRWQASQSQERLSNTWLRYELDWIVPYDSQSKRLQIILNDFDGEIIDVLSAGMCEVMATHCHALWPLTPSGYHTVLEINWSDKSITRNFGKVREPLPEWNNYNISIRLPEDKSVVRAYLQLYLGSELRLQTRDYTWTVDEGQVTALPLPSSRRQTLWLNHANLLGHSVAAIFMSFASLALLHASYRAFILGFLVALFGSVLTGSHAAILVIALSGFVAAAVIQKRFCLFPLLLIGLSLFLLPFVASNLPERVDAWNLAWATFLASPFWGLGSDEFTMTLQTRFSGINHAHNFWLQNLALYGIMGLLAALWLSFGLVKLSWDKGGYLGLIISIPIMVLQLVDYTFFYSGVLYPMLLGLAFLKRGKY